MVDVYGEELPVETTRSAKEMWNRVRVAGLTTTTPRAGDLIFFWRQAPWSWKGHVGIGAHSDGTTIRTIEGNVGGRVVERFYRLDEIPQLLGFGKIQ